jgi:hypothetical protein
VLAQAGPERINGKGKPVKTWIILPRPEEARQPTIVNDESDDGDPNPPLHDVEERQDAAGPQCGGVETERSSMAWRGNEAPQVHHVEERQDAAPPRHAFAPPPRSAPPTPPYKDGSVIDPSTAGQTRSLLGEAGSRLIPWTVEEILDEGASETARKKFGRDRLPFSSSALRQIAGMFLDVDALVRRYLERTKGQKILDPSAYLVAMAREEVSKREGVPASAVAALDRVDRAQRFASRTDAIRDLALLAEQAPARPSSALRDLVQRQQGARA